MLREHKQGPSCSRGARENHRDTVKAIPMKHDRNGDFIIARLDDGEDMHASLKTIAERYGLHSGIILAGIGMLRDLEIGFFDNGEYLTERIEGPCELVSTQGSIAYGIDPGTGERGELMLHLHCTLGKRDHSVIGGHLNSATVAVLNEITMLRLDRVRLKRELNEKSGLYELNL